MLGQLPKRGLVKSFYADAEFRCFPWSRRSPSP